MRKAANRLLGLPGREPSTLGELETLIEQAGLVATIQHYVFWSGDYSNPNLEHEVTVAAGSGAELVIAKSIGCVIALLALQGFHVRPLASVFLGVPLRRLRAENGVGLLERYCRSVPTLIIQQTDDPTGTFDQLSDALGSQAKAELVEISGNCHNYDRPDVAELLIQWRSTLHNINNPGDDAA